MAQKQSGGSGSGSGSGNKGSGSSGGNAKSGGTTYGGNRSGNTSNPNAGTVPTNSGCPRGTGGSGTSKKCDYLPLETDRKNVVPGKRGPVRGVLGGARTLKKKTT